MTPCRVAAAGIGGVEGSHSDHFSWGLELLRAIAAGCCCLDHAVGLGRYRWTDSGHPVGVLDLRAAEPAPEPPGGQAGRGEGRGAAPIRRQP